MIRDLNSLKSRLDKVQGLKNILRVSTMEIDCKGERLVINVPSSDDATVLRHTYGKELSKNSINTCEAIEIKCRGKRLYLFNPESLI